jgi:hypothetical protein
VRIARPTSAGLVAMALAGEALIDSGFDVNDVQADVHMMGRA